MTPRADSAFLVSPILLTAAAEAQKNSRGGARKMPRTRPQVEDGAPSGSSKSDVNVRFRASRRRGCRENNGSGIKGDGGLFAVEKGGAATAPMLMRRPRAPRPLKNLEVMNDEITTTTAAAAGAQPQST
jgi:hypothetical protein